VTEHINNVNKQIIDLIFISRKVLNHFFAFLSVITTIRRQGEFGGALCLVRV